MSDPNDRPGRNPPPPDEPPTLPPRKNSISPLIWLLLLIALIAAGWYFYSQRGVMEAPAEPETPIEDVAEADDSAPPPESERAAPARRPAPAPAPRGITRAADPIERVEPVYPPTALRAGQEGSVLLRVQVGADGSPTDVEVARSSRSRDLDRAARDAVRKWKFSPAMENGQAVASTVEVPIDFQVEGQ